MKLRQTVTTKQTQTQKLKQLLSPKIIQMLKVFNTPYRDLLEQIRAESADNVLIEIQQPDRLEQYEMGLRKQSSSTLNQKDLSDFAGDTKGQSLREFLLSQLNLIAITDDKKVIAEYLIDAIDSRGYLTDFKEIRDEICKRFDVKDRTVIDILKTIQTFEPDGVAARSLKECLLIQLEHYELDNQDLRDIIELVIKQHTDDLAVENYEKIANSVDLSVDGVQSIHEFIKNNFNPSPGSGYSNEQFDYSVIPSFEVSLDDTNKVIIKNLEESLGIKINISTHYLNLLADPAIDKETKTFLTEKLQKAKELESNLLNRTNTMDKIASYLFNKQVMFLNDGFDYLIPLLQKDVARDLNMNPSTVSRIFSSKYCRTPHGIFSLKQLCPRSHFGKTAVQLKKIIQATMDENPSLSDQKLANLLTYQGIPIKRRTVTKYRHELGVNTRFKRDSNTDSAKDK
tara:strand:- start:183 stop:1547 length:1365 start_codon:yes stop_codon:yes gene_type:complete